MLCRASNLTTDDVPQQKAAFHASFDAITMSKKNLCSSGPYPCQSEIALDRVGLKKCCGRLHDADVVLERQRQSPRQKLGKRYKIRVEDRDVIRPLFKRLDHLEGGVDISGLRMLVSLRVR